MSAGIRAIIYVVAFVLLCVACFAVGTYLAARLDGGYSSDRQLVRICEDGTHIFRYPDGVIRTGRGYVVTNPMEVCS
jgi:hypothetical protein